MFILLPSMPIVISKFLCTNKSKYLILVVEKTIRHEKDLFIFYHIIVILQHKHTANKNLAYSILHHIVICKYSFNFRLSSTKSKHRMKSLELNENMQLFVLI